MLQLSARPATAPSSTYPLLTRGIAPGKPKHTGHTRVFGIPPYLFSHAQNAFVFVVSCVCISQPITISVFSIITIILRLQTATAVSATIYFQKQGIHIPDDRFPSTAQSVESSIR